jgi:uncharacterized DUF497 family protein
MSIKFDWDLRKAQRNLLKHGIDFDEASTVFADTLSITIPDPDHSEDEERWVTRVSRIASACSLWYTLKKKKRSVSSVHGRQTALSGGNMKKETRRDDEMRDHYDFTGGVRGKYARRYAEGTNVVVLDPDVAPLFPNREAVNETLRAVAQLVQLQERRRGKANQAIVPDRRPVTVRKERERTQSGGGR